MNDARVNLPHRNLKLVQQKKKTHFSRAVLVAAWQKRGGGRCNPFCLSVFDNDENILTPHAILPNNNR
jgi:hypothetical protein